MTKKQENLDKLEQIADNIIQEFGFDVISTVKKSYEFTYKGHRIHFKMQPDPIKKYKKPEEEQEIIDYNTEGIIY